MSNSVYSIVKDGTMGYNVVALRDILPGELIVREISPILRISKEFRSRQAGGNYREVEMAAYKVFVKDLSADQQKVVLSLFGPTTGESAANIRQYLSQLGTYRHLTETEFETLVKVMQVVTFNAFELENDGHALYTDITRFSHSCQPNCSYSFRGKAVYCYARKHIKAGEELTLSYVTMRDMEPIHERRYKYLETKEFTCHCPRCDAPGDDTRQFDCFDPKCKGVMMVCQPINQKKLPFSDLVYTGVEYVEPHLLPCTVCHRAAPADYQREKFVVETQMLHLGPTFSTAYIELLKTNKYEELEPLLNNLMSVEIQRRHAAAILLLRTEMMLRVTLARWGVGTRMLASAQKAALKYLNALENLFPYPTDSLCDGLGNIVFAIKLCQGALFEPPQQKDVCGKALRMHLLLRGRDRRETDLDEALLQCHMRLSSAQSISTEICAFCEESPLHAALTLSRCGRCMKVAYCSVGCQKAHWKLHKKTCTAPEGKR